MNSSNTQCLDLLPLSEHFYCLCVFSCNLPQRTQEQRRNIVSLSVEFLIYNYSVIFLIHLALSSCPRIWVSLAKLTRETLRVYTLRQQPPTPSHEEILSAAGSSWLQH